MAPSVAEFYAGKCVLITGGTGFVGKMLIEKLLRHCPDVDTIYLLLRPKRGHSSDERLRTLCSNPLFEPLKQVSPALLGKLRVISGDILLDGLGLSAADRTELQQRCHIFFHSAANVRFDQKLKDAVNQNTAGTERALKLAETMEKLEAFVHLSTAYCRCYLQQLEERLYPPVHDPAHIMDICRWMDDDLLAHTEPKIIESEPNTYSYTKAITEDLVAKYSGKFPIAIARPSIVTAVWKEPIVGWVDNMQGPTGVLIAAGRGVLRTMHCIPHYKADGLPVDVVANGCILIAYATSLDKPKETAVYNITQSQVIDMDWGQIIESGKKYLLQYPFSLSMWYIGGSIKQYRATHELHAFFSQLLPAYFFDAILFLLGKKTFLVKIQKRIGQGLKVFTYYTTKEWYFKNTNFLSLQQRLSPEERERFYIDVSSMDPEEYLKNYVLGVRKYMCHEDNSTLPYARRLNTIRWILDVMLTALLYFLVLWLVYSYWHVFPAGLRSLDAALKTLSPLPSDDAHAAHAAHAAHPGHDAHAPYTQAL